VGCSDDAPPVGDPDAAVGDDAGPWTGADLAGACDLDKRIGGFLIEVGLANYVDGEVKNAVQPNTVLDEVQRDGACVLRKKTPPFCDPACDLTTQVCGLDETCQPAPRNQDVGRVTVAGLSHEVSLEADGQKRYSDTTFTAAPFSPGAQIQLDAAGGDTVPAFRLRGIGLAPLALPVLEWVITPGQPLTVQWTTVSGSEARVHLRLNVDQHGNTPIALECDAPDTGTFTIPASMVDALLAGGQSGVPNAKIDRRTVDSVTAGPGCVELEVRSRVGEPQLHLSVAGVHYCTPPQMCPEGETCNADFICE